MAITRTDQVYEGAISPTRTTVATIASSTTFVMRGYLLTNHTADAINATLRIGSGTKIVPYQEVAVNDGIIQSDINVGITTGDKIEISGTVGTAVGGTDTQFDITNPSGDTIRYTYDSTGTDPDLDGNFEVDDYVYINAQNFSSGNNGTFKITAVGTDYIEVENSSGVVESNKTIGTGSINKLGSYYIWGVNEVTS